MFVLAAVLLCGIPAHAQDNPLSVPRPDAVYESVLTDRRIHREVSSFYMGLYGKPDGYTDKEWDEEQRNFLLESAYAGVDGPFLPRAFDKFGEEGIEELYEKYGMKFPFYFPFRQYSDIAKANGALFVFPTALASWERGLTACWDPKFIEVATTELEKWLRVYGKKPWLSSVIGQDEPFNWAGTLRNPAVVAMVNRELKEKYGVKIALTANDTTLAMPWEFTDPAVLNKPFLDVALMRVAVWRWLNDRIYEAAKPNYELVHRYAPGVMYHAYNRNAISIMDFITKDVPNSIDRIDQSKIYDVTDCFSSDPYPTRNLARDGRERALFHIGFIGKFTTDLGAGKPSKIIMQAFKEYGRPNQETLREWTSQIAKVGVTHLEWFGASRFPYPEDHREILRLSKLWKNLPALDIPETSDISVLFSNDSRAAMDDAIMHSFYMLHVLLGERIGAWYTFTSENYVRRGLQSLDNAKLIIAPQLSFVSKEFSDKLIDRVKNGATLVVLDPDALTYDIETGSLASQRKALIGVPIGKKRDASHLTATDIGSKRFGGIKKLLLQPGKTGVIARTIKSPRGAKVLFTYEDGRPAAYSHSLGKGEVIVFSAMPFGNSADASNPSYSKQALTSASWERFFTSLCDEMGIKRNLPLWNFLLPETGCEAATFRHIRSSAK